MGAGRSHQTSAHNNAHRQPAVHGLDAGRSHARKAQRRRQRSNRVVTSFLTIIVIAAAAGGGWLAYSAYVEHDTNEQLETDRRVAEIERDRQGRTAEDVIVLLEDQPAWNGPGNPNFGVGSDVGQP